MDHARIEHANITVTNPEETAAALSRMFGWHIRWQGPSAMGGRTVHVGTDDEYIAVYTPERALSQAEGNYETPGGLNHIGVLVDDLNAVEARVLNEGYKTFNHANYEPGRRFYFLDADGIEFEVVSYSS